MEAISRELDGVTTGTISDAFGNTLGNTTALNLVNWTSMRVSGFGPVKGYQVPVLSVSVSLLEAKLWRGKRLDPTGFYHFGVRYEDPVAGRWLSPDPMGHAVSLSLYDYCGNDPINGLDPDGRVAKVGLAYAGGFVEGAAEGIGNELIGLGKFAKGATFDLGQQITLTGLDAYEAYSNGNGDFESAMFKGVFNQTLEGKPNGDMAKELALNVSGYRFGNQIYENLERGHETGDYSQFSQNMGTVAGISAFSTLFDSSGVPDRIYTQVENIDAIAKSGRVWGQTEGSVYGMAMDNAPRWRSMANPKLVDPGTVVFEGDAAGLFRPHPVEGVYSALKRVLGQYKSGFGDIVFDPSSVAFDGSTLTMRSAELGAHAGQSELWAASRLWGRRTLDAGLTIGVAYETFDGP